MTTPEQLEQMQRDTGVGLRIVDGRSRYAAVVKAPAWGDDDPRFYNDTEWLGWFGEAYPAWVVEDMTDATEAGLSWVVFLERRPPDDELVVERVWSDGRAEMPLVEALDWLHGHGYAEDVEIASTYLEDGGTIQTPSSQWRIVR